ncbi:MAG: hemerythrin domain-containing protein [Flavisolibacter sp.]
MQRYNAFNIIHKGLRAALFQTALQLQQTDFTDEEQAEEAVNKVKEIVMLFEGHAHKEDNYVLPLINEYEPSVVASFNSEHEEDGRLGNELNDAVQRVLNSEGFTEKAISGRELTESFVRFMVFNLNHMAKEEDIINKILWRYYSDDELKAVVAKISQADPPWIQEFYVKWMIRGINNTEAIEWMKAAGKAAPAVVFKGLVQKAEQELPKQRFQKISASLTEELKVA